MKTQWGCTVNTMSCAVFRHVLMTHPQLKHTSVPTLLMQAIKPLQSWPALTEQMVAPNCAFWLYWREAMNWSVTTQPILFQKLRKSFIRISILSKLAKESHLRCRKTMLALTREPTFVGINDCYASISELSWAETRKINECHHKKLDLLKKVHAS